MTTDAVSVTLGSWMRMTALPESLVTRNSCLQQMTARPLTRKRGNKRSKENKSVKMSVKLTAKKVAKSQTKMLTLRVTNKMISKRVKRANLYQLAIHTCRIVIMTRRELQMMIKSRRVAMTRRRNWIDQHKTHR